MEIDKLLNDLGIQVAEFSATYKSPTGTAVMLELDKARKLLNELELNAPDFSGTQNTVHKVL